MYIVTAEEMRALDRFAIERWGIPAPSLMENAGRAVAEQVLRRCGDDRAKPWIVLVGKGNNGADGVVAARHLHEAEVGVHLLYATDPSAFAGEAALQRDIAARMGLASSVYAPGSVPWDRFAGIVDALLGTGSGGAPREPYASLIREANASGLPIVSVDIPSGLDADTGRTHDPCIRAHATVALAFLKRGLTQYPGKQAAGEIAVRPIGIPASLAAAHPVRTMLADAALVRTRFGAGQPPDRPPASHKGTYGHVLVAAGSSAYSGAGLLCATAAMRAGAGLVTWALPRNLQNRMAGLRPELMLHAVEDDGDGGWTEASAVALVRICEGKGALAVGPGLSRFPGDRAWLRRLWEDAACPLVLDADALNIAAEADDFRTWPDRRAPVVMTPHPGEMARLAGLSIREIEHNRIDVARRYAETHRVVLVLKGAATVTATPDGEAFVNTTGNPGMATGGSGDVLTGIIASLLAQGKDAVAAAVLGVFVHGSAGDRAAARRTSQASLLAGDIVEAL